MAGPHLKSITDLPRGFNIYSKNIIDTDLKNNTIDIEIVAIRVPFNSVDDSFESFVNPAKFEELVKEYNSLTYIIGKIVRLAEIINYNVVRIVDEYIELHGQENILDRSSKCRELQKFNLENLDFLQASRVLSCILNTDKNLQQIMRFSTKEKIRDYNSKLYNYIIDRNYFTHGYMVFEFPTMQPIIEIRNNTGKHFFYFSKNIADDNLTTFYELYEGLTDIMKKFYESYN